MSNKTILFADDSATMRALMEKTFAAEPIDVVTVPSGEAAIGKARELRPTVIIVDAGMAGVSGYDVCQAIREDADLSYTPVIITAGVSNPYDEAKGRQVRVTEYVKKPFDTTQIIDKVNQLVDKLEPDFREPSLSSTRPTPAGGVPAATPQPAPSKEAPQPMRPRGFEPSPREAFQPPSRVQPRADGGPVQKPGADPISSLRADTLAEMSQFDDRGEPISLQQRDDAIDLDGPTLESSVPTDEPLELTRPAKDTLSRPAKDTRQPEKVPSETKPKAKPSRPVSSAELRISKAAQDVAAGVPSLTPEQADAIRALTAEVIERVVWEVVPDLAETIIKEKIEALLEE